MADELVPLFLISLLLNLALGFLVVGKYVTDIKPSPTRKIPKDIEFVKYCAAILLGFWGGIVGNAFVTAMFKVQESFINTWWFWPAMFIICAIGTILFTLKIYSAIEQASE